LAAAYGHLPQEIARLPWIQVRVIWESYVKRQAREWKMQSALAGVSMAGGMGAMLGGGTETAPTTHPAQLVSMGLPVDYQKAE
jgi:hypothetical protein